MRPMSRQPLAEVFGFPIDNLSTDAHRYRSNRLCPYHNRVPSCTKDKARDPLGVCSVFDGDAAVITCPIRFRQDWLVKDGRSAGNIDIVLAAYDEHGRVIDFGALEVQAVYISGNVRRPFEHYMHDPDANCTMDWSPNEFYPRPDYLSSSRKRLAPQLLFKGGILSAWGKKQAVAMDRRFFESLPSLPEVPSTEADMAWLVYELVRDDMTNRYRLMHHKTAYTRFDSALTRLTVPNVGDLPDFLGYLQARLDDKLDGGYAPEAPILGDLGDM